MSLSVITGICFLFITTFQCHPISFFWNKNQDGTCINIDVIIAFTYLYSAFSVICDFTFALLPIFLIMQLQMNNKTKLALIPVMLMACVYVFYNYSLLLSGLLLNVLYKQCQCCRRCSIPLCQGLQDSRLLV